MSLLIKALQKAEDEKTADATLGASVGELSLEPLTADKTQDTQQTTSPETISRPQQAAAGVFTAKQRPAGSQTNRKKLLMIGIAALLLVLLIGMQVYSYINSLEQPQAIIPRPPAVQVPTQPPAIQSEVTTEADGTANTPAAPESNASVAAAAEDTVARAEASAAQPATPETTEVPDKPVASIAKPRAAQPEELVMGEPVAAPEQGALQITRNPVEVGISPDLAAAYQAFNAGDDAKAQYHYRKVLQSDVRNIDALLGMAGIASRQGRMQDAGGWYAKVLEIDPRNTVAQAALASGYAQVDPVGAESRIKNMLAQKPDAAHLHAALGNLYAENGNWPQAQQSYFQAHHFAPSNADYAFNLAISLDHLGKPALALQYYQQALVLLAPSGSGNIDRAQLESRIQQLQ